MEFYNKIDGKSIVGCKLLNYDRTLQKSIYNFPSLANTLSAAFFLYTFFPKSRKLNKYHQADNFKLETKKVDVVTGGFYVYGKRRLFESKWF